MTEKKGAGRCPYNDGVDCAERVCEKGRRCGWRIDTETDRKRRIREHGHKRIEAKGKESKPSDCREPTRDRSEYQAVRRARLLAEGKCVTCGQKNDRSGKIYCSACYERKKVLEKAKEKFLR